MKKYLSIVLLTVLLLSTISLAALASSKEAVYYADSLLSRAREAGYRLREEENDLNVGYLDEGDSFRYSTTLYYGNEYAICVVGDDDAVDVDIAIFDENFNKIYEDDEATFEGIAYVAPEWTGTFYVRVTMYEVESYTDGAYFCQFVTYKSLDI